MLHFFFPRQNDNQLHQVGIWCWMSHPSNHTKIFSFLLKHPSINKINKKSPQCIAYMYIYIKSLSL